MDEIKKLTEDIAKDISASKGFNIRLITKDYYVTVILYLLKDVKGIFFKGGTALQKIFLDYSRLSEDVDYTCVRDIAEVKEEINEIIKKSEIFDKITKDKDVDDFLRLVVHYKDFAGVDDTVFIDLNKRAKLIDNPESHKINHFYDGMLPDFKVNTLSQHEMVAEKVSATIGRNKPRDHFDVYKILENGMKLDDKLISQKCKSSGNEYDVTKMFNKAKTLHKRWDDDLLPLLAEEVTFKEVIQSLAEHFGLKEEKKKKSLAKAAKKS